MASITGDSSIPTSDPPPYTEDQPPAYPRIFNVSRTYDESYQLRLPGESHEYFAENTCFVPAKPDFMLHAGPDKQGPVLAACKFDDGDDLKICIGDPILSSRVQWEDVRKASSFKHDYRWTTTATAPPRNLVWKRTKTESVSGKKPSLIESRNLKLVDDKSGEVLAVFTGGDLWVRGGQLEFRGELGEEFDWLVILCLVSFYEKSYRKNHAMSGDAGVVRFNRTMPDAAGYSGSGGNIDFRPVQPVAKRDDAADSKAT